VAWHPKSSTQNERSTIVIRRNDGTEILVRQIAGAVARRICTYAKPGDNAEQGEEFGFIKFGSRVDVFLPLNSNIECTLNQVSKNKLTILANV
jgi:phosphatidylserine decarboxylase